MMIREILYDLYHYTVYCSYDTNEYQLHERLNSWSADAIAFWRSSKRQIPFPSVWIRLPIANVEDEHNLSVLLVTSRDLQEVCASSCSNYSLLQPLISLRITSSLPPLFSVLSFSTRLTSSLEMSSWSGSHPPPPRRSRSRSPSRGAYGRAPYPDGFGYAQDAYRPDWDPYNRERAWVDWERDRVGYDYSRRGRSRSPPFDDCKYLPKTIIV